MARSRRVGSASAAIRRSSSALAPTRDDGTMVPEFTIALNVVRPRDITLSVLAHILIDESGVHPWIKSRGPASPGMCAQGKAENPPRRAGPMDRILVETRTVQLARAQIRPAPELSVVVPTFNERSNVPLLVARLQRTLDGVDWEVIFVDDDSPDGTAAAVRTLEIGRAHV